MDKKLLDNQYLDSKYEKYYLISWPECQQFDEIDEGTDDIIPIMMSGTATPATFVSESLIEELKQEQDGF